MRRPAADAFVGRNVELQALQSELDVVVDEGMARTVLLEGPAGIGKSWLLGRFLAAAGEMRVLEASGDEYEARVDYGVVDQLLTRASAGGCATPPGAGSPARVDPVAVGFEVLHLLGELAASHPLVVVVDDAQWADPPSLQALTLALRRLHADRVLALVVSRDAAEALPEGLLRLADERGRRLTIPPLEEPDLSDLARALGAGELPPPAIRRLREHTGGNPLYARALLEELGADALRATAGSLPAPRSFTMVVASRLAACQVDTRNLVQAAAVIGSTAPVGLAAQVAGVGGPGPAVEEALGARLLEVVDNRMFRAVAFPHPLVRAAVYHDLGPARRSMLHGRAGELLDGGASLEHRAAAALVEDPALAAELAEEARSEADRGAPLAAAARLLDAARLSPAPSDKAEHLVGAVELLLGAGQITEALALAADVGALPDTPRRNCLLGYLSFMTGQRQEAETLLMAAWEKCDPTVDAPLRALVAGRLAQIRAMEFRPQEVVTWARRSVESGDPAAPYPFALTMLVSYLAVLGCPDQALAQVASVSGDDPEPTGADIEGLVSRGLVRGWVGDFLGAQDDLTKAVEVLDQGLASPPGLLALGGLAQVEYRLGRWDQSVARACLSISLATDAGQVWMLSWVHSHATWVLAARGAWDDAETHVRAANEGALAMGDEVSRGCAMSAKVYLAFCRGSPEAVVEAAQDLAALCRDHSEQPGIHAWRELYAEALVSLGRPEEAEAALQPLERVAAERNHLVSLAAAARARGAVEAARGDVCAARSAFEAALDQLDDGPVPFDRALAHAAYGRFLRRSGSRTEAARHLRAAGDIFVALCARPFAEQVERELAGCGLAPRRRSAVPRAQLTPQELAVAQLVADGRTNREVAAQLFVSAKTVEYHLGHIFTKLGVTSRRQLKDRLAADVPWGQAD